jgi:hypothetical protein
MRAPGATVTAIVRPPSAAIVIELPETALTVPRSDAVEAAAAAAGAGAWATMEVPVTRKSSPTPSEIVSKRHLFRVAICILIQIGFGKLASPVKVPSNPRKAQELRSIGWGEFSLLKDTNPWGKSFAARQHYTART